MDFELSQNRPLTWLIITLLTSLTSIWIVSVYRYRLKYYSLHGPLKAAPFSMWFGSVPAIASLYKTSPQETHPMCTMTLLSQKHDLGGIYFLDTWPFSDMRQLCVADPDIAAQAVQKHDLPKYHIYPHMISHVTGKTSMLILHGAPWKKIRSLFNPGFSATHLNTLVPMIVDDVLIYHSILSSLADKGEVTQMEEPLTRLTVDIMGHVILDHDLNSQTSENELVNAFRASVEWTPSAMMTAPIFRLNPVRKFWHWYYARKMDDYLKKVVQERVGQRTNGSADVEKKGRRPAIDLAIDEYMLAEGDESEGNVSEEFQQVAIDQMKTFLFAGHDTSSSIGCYIYYLLNLHPEDLARVRKEHDDVFGDIASTGEKIKNDPKLLNELPYTTAVIKETLRIFTPASTAREGQASCTLTYNGTSYPTAGSMVWINNHTIHHTASLFPSPNAFLPARFLPSTHPLFSLSPQASIPKDAYRPFEKGPRGCIGQELAMLELKIIMLLTIREFDVEAAYKEWDAKLGREKPGDMLDGRRGMFGHRAYQQMKVTAKPVDGMPARVSKRKHQRS